MDRDDLAPIFLDGEVVLEDGSMALPVGIALNLHNEVVADDADGALLDLGDLVTIVVFDGHGIAKAGDAVLDLKEDLSRQVLEVEGLPSAEDLVVGLVRGLALAAAAAHPVDGEVVAEGQELLAHGEGLGTRVVVRFRARIGTLTSLVNGHASHSTGGGSDGHFRPGTSVLATLVTILATILPSVLPGSASHVFRLLSYESFLCICVDLTHSNNFNFNAYCAGY